MEWNDYYLPRYIKTLGSQPYDGLGLVMTRASFIFRGFIYTYSEFQGVPTLSLYYFGFYNLLSSLLLYTYSSSSESRISATVGH
jgi:hypothetical protein